MEWVSGAFHWLEEYLLYGCCDVQADMHNQLSVHCTVSKNLFKPFATGVAISMTTET